MVKIKYKCGCVREIKDDGDLIHCCDKHKIIESQLELEDALSEEYDD